MNPARLFCIFLLLVGSLTARSQNINWQSLPKEVNGRVCALYVYNGKMVAAGSFTKAGPDSFSYIAAWDGNSWSGFGKGIRGAKNSYSTIIDVVAFQGDLYVAGMFDTAGNVAAHNIARWDGQQWHAVGSGVGPDAGASSLAVYNNELYMGGLFTTMDNMMYTYKIARWNGTAWQAVGDGIQPNGVGGVIQMKVFNGELYALGDIAVAGSVAANNLARWNGTDWNSVSGSEFIADGSRGLGVSNSKLLIGSRGELGDTLTNLYRWDGVRLDTFSRQHMYQGGYFLSFNTLDTFKGKLYAGMSPKVNSTDTTLVYVWQDSVWREVGSGINAVVDRLCSFQGSLYCSGIFNKQFGGNHNFIARLGPATGINNQPLPTAYAKVYPSPAPASFTLETDPSLTRKKVWLYLRDITGRTFLMQSISAPKTVIKRPEQPGIYFWEVTADGRQVASGKLVAE